VGDGMRVRQLSRGLTEVNGQRLERNAVAEVRPGAVVRVAGVLNLRLEAAATTSAATQYTRYEG